MPQIIVVADGRAERHDHAVMFTERVSVDDFESRHFQAQLVERLGWAVGDAHAAEQGQPVTWDEDEPSEDRAPPGCPHQRRSASVVTTAS